MSKKEYTTLQEIKKKYCTNVLPGMCAGCPACAAVEEAHAAGITEERSRQSEYYLRIAGVAMEGFYQFRGEDK